MKFQLAIVLLLGCACSATAQFMRENWRSGLPNVSNGPQYYAQAAAADSDGSVFVAGSLNLSGNRTQFVAKFDSQGFKVWEYWYNGGFNKIEALTSDLAGGCLVGVSSGFGGIQVNRLTLAPVYIGPPSLSFQYIAYEPWLFSPDRPSMHLTAKDTNSVFIAGLREDPDTGQFWYRVSCHQQTYPYEVLWSTNVAQSAGTSQDFNRTMAVGQDFIAVAASSFAARLSFDGRVEWVVRPDETTFWGSIAISGDGAVGVAGAGRFAVYGPDGQLRGRHRQNADCYVAAHPANSDFMLNEVWLDSLLYRMASDGRITARSRPPVSTRGFGAYGTIPIQESYWLCGAIEGFNLSPQQSRFAFLSVNPLGVIQNFQTVGGYEYDTSLRTTGHWLFNAPDGSVRLVVNTPVPPYTSGRPHGGVVVGSFSIESLTNSVTVEPLSKVIPPSSETRTLTPMASGGGPLEYQWLRVGAVLQDETNSTLVLQPGDSGSYSVRVSDGTNIVGSNIAVVQSYPLTVIVAGADDSSFTLETLSGNDAQFEVQESGSLESWRTLPVIYGIGIFGPSGPIHVPATNQPSSFFRAVEVH